MYLYIDIYMPDFKYAENSLAKKLSNVDNYFEIATQAIKEMYKQVGTAQFDENGIRRKAEKAAAKRRHLFLYSY